MSTDSVISHAVCADFGQVTRKATPHFAKHIIKYTKTKKFMPENFMSMTNHSGCSWLQFQMLTLTAIGG